MPHMRVTLMLIDADGYGNEAALSLLADDFEEALGVYEHVYPLHQGTPRMFEVRRIATSGDGDTTQPDSALPALGDVPVYAIACTQSPHADAATRALEYTERMCSTAGAMYRGGVAVAGGQLIAPCASKPRMGRMRRWCSEAIDTLVLAARSGCSVCELADMQRLVSNKAARPIEPSDKAANVVVARCPVPTCAYQAAVRHYERKARTK